MVERATRSNTGCVQISLNTRLGSFFYEPNDLSPGLCVVAVLCLKHGVARIIIVMVAVVGIYGV
jgi:hypothetical protein